MTVPALPDLPLDRVRDLVPVQFLGLTPGQGAVAYAVALLGLVGALVTWVLRSHGGRGGGAAGAVSTRSGLVAAAAVIFAAHGVALLPALTVVGAGRVAIYPGLLLLTSLALLLLAVAQGVAPRRARVLLAAAGALAIAVAGLQLERCAALHEERKALFALRRAIYDYVLGLHRYTGASAFVLTTATCPAADRAALGAAGLLHLGPSAPPAGLHRYERRLPGAARRAGLHPGLVPAVPPVAARRPIGVRVSCTLEPVRCPCCGSIDVCLWWAEKLPWEVTSTEFSYAATGATTADPGLPGLRARLRPPAAGRRRGEPLLGVEDAHTCARGNAADLQ
jgi:hypothetical protein